MAISAPVAQSARVGRRYAAGLDNRGVRGQRPQHLDGVVGGVVVGDDQPPVEAGHAVGERGEETGQHRGAVPGDDDDGDGAQRVSTSSGSWTSYVLRGAG